MGIEKTKDLRIGEARLAALAAKGLPTLDVREGMSLAEEVMRLRATLKSVAALATYDEEDRGEPDEDDMIEALCNIYNLTRAHA